MKRKRKTRNLLLLGTAGVVSAYIGSQLKSVKHRYVVDEKTIDCANYRLEQLPIDNNPRSKQQPFFHCNIRRKVDNRQVGVGILYFGQEANSYYGGHIVITPNDGITEDFKKEVTAALIHLAKVKMMSHLYFVTSKKDLETIQEIEELGAKFTKEIYLPENHPNYVPKQEKIRQYRLELSD